MRKITLILSLLCLVCFGVNAQVELDLVDGAIYKIMNIKYSANCIEDAGTNNAKVAPFLIGQKKQWWVVQKNDDGSFFLKNYNTKRYLTGSNNGGGRWVMTSTATPKLYIYKHSDGQYFISAISLTNPNATSRTCAHHPGDHFELVTWDNVENGNPLQPSTWNFVKLYDDESSIGVINKDALNDAISRGKSLMQDAGFNISIGDAVQLTVGENGNLTTNQPAIDGDKLANCIDKDPSTLFHSNWQSNTSGGHYLQIDLGEDGKLGAFQLNYTTRQSGNNAAPYEVVVYGSNDDKNFVALAELSKNDELNPLPSNNGPSYSTTIVADKEYRFIRFTVLSSPNDDGSFGLAELSLNKATVTRPVGDYENRYHSQTFLYMAIELAEIMNNNVDIDQISIDNAVEKVEQAIVYASKYPFAITSDKNNPVCYAIKSGRTSAWDDGDYYWTFIPGNGGALTIFPATTKNSEEYKKNIYKYWFFQETFNGCLKMIPVADRNNPMGYLKVENGKDKMRNDATVQGFVGDTYRLVYNKSYTEYPYALQPSGTTNYVSNYGGKSNNPNMGFWDGDGFEDTGGRIDFIKLSTPSAKLEELASVVERASSLESGTAIGHYTSDAITELSTYITSAIAVLADATSSSEICQAQIDALNNVIDNLQINLPVDSKFYKIVSHCTKDHRANQQVYVSKDGDMHFCKPEHTIGIAAGTIAHIFQFIPADEGKFYIYNVQRGVYMKAVGGQHLPAQVTTDISSAKPVAIKHLGVDNVIGIYPDGQEMMHAQDEGSKIVGWNETNATDGSAWIIKEVEDIAELSQDVAIGNAGYATLCLGYNATIPEGVEAYAVSSTNSTHAIMTQINGAIPANEAVILKLAEGAEVKTYQFNYVAEANKIENILQGSTVDTYIDGNAYVLGYINEDGEDAKVGFGKALLTDNKFLNNANKAYLPIASGTALSASLRFDFGGTTAIEEVEIRNEREEIYDLTGRRVNEITKAGVYVVNGRKVMVK